MGKRECSDCRENEKTFRSNINYKCQNDYCENYIKPTPTEKKIEPPVLSRYEPYNIVVSKYSDFKHKIIIELVEQLFEKDKEIAILKQEINLLRK